MVLNNVLKFYSWISFFAQHTSGADLALLLVAVLEKTDTQATNEIIGEDLHFTI